jgi:hypothetical protein
LGRPPGPWETRKRRRTEAATSPGQESVRTEASTPVEPRQVPIVFWPEDEWSWHRPGRAPGRP